MNQNSNICSQSFVVRYFETGSRSVLTPTALLTMLEETAATHCRSIGCSLPFLQTQNLGWILLGGYMQMEAYPEYKDALTINTWISEYSRVRAYRENLIYDSCHRVIGLARSRWVLFDTSARRPVEIPESIRNGWGMNSQKCTEVDIDEKITALKTGDFHSDCIVSHFDIDTYGHVNNIRYLQWLLESTPKEVKDNSFLYSVNGRFLHESYIRDRITSLTTPAASGEGFLHTISADRGGTPLSVAETVWRPW